MCAQVMIVGKFMVAVSWSAIWSRRLLLCLAGGIFRTVSMQECFWCVMAVSINGWLCFACALLPFSLGILYQERNRSYRHHHHRNNCIMLGKVATVGASSSARMNAATLSRLRLAATSNERLHQFSTLQAIPQHFLLHQQPHVATGLPSRDDDDDDAQNKSHRSNILRH